MSYPSLPFFTQPPINRSATHSLQMDQLEEVCCAKQASNRRASGFGRQRSQHLVVRFLFAILISLQEFSQSNQDNAVCAF